jgi:hypothetical protein
MVYALTCAHRQTVQATHLEVSEELQISSPAACGGRHDDKRVKSGRLCVARGEGDMWVV